MTDDIWSTRFRSVSPDELDDDDESGDNMNVNDLFRAVADTGFSRLAFELDLDSREGNAKYVQTPFSIANQRAAMGIGNQVNEKSRGSIRPADPATRKELETQSKTAPRPIAKVKNAANVGSSRPIMTSTTLENSQQNTSIKTSASSTNKPFPFPTNTFAPSPPRKLKKSQISGWTDHKGRPIPKDPPRRTSVLDDIAKKDEKDEKAAKKREAAKRSRERAKERKEKEKQEQQSIKFSKLPQDVDDTPLGKGFERQRQLPVKDKSSKGIGKGKGKKKDLEVIEISPPPSPTHVTREIAEQLVRGEIKKAPTFKRPMDQDEQLRLLSANWLKGKKVSDQGSNRDPVSEDEITNGPEPISKNWNQFNYLTAAESSTTESERDEAFQVSAFAGPMRESNISNAPKSPRSDPSTITRLPTSAFREDSSSSVLPYSSPLVNHERDRLLREVQAERAKEEENRRKRVQAASLPDSDYLTPAWSKRNHQHEGKLTPSPSPAPKKPKIEEWSTIQPIKRVNQNQKNRHVAVDIKANSRFSALNSNNNNIKDGSSRLNAQKARHTFVKSLNLFKPAPPSATVSENLPEKSVKEGYTIKTNKGTRYGASGEQYSRSISPPPLPLGQYDERAWTRDQMQGSYEYRTNQPSAYFNDINIPYPYRGGNSQAQGRPTDVVKEDTDEDRFRRNRRWEIPYQQMRGRGNVSSPMRPPPPPPPRTQQIYENGDYINRFGMQEYDHAPFQNQTYRFDQAQARAQDSGRSSLRNSHEFDHKRTYY